MNMTTVGAFFIVLSMSCLGYDIACFIRLIYRIYRKKNK